MTFEQMTFEQLKTLEFDLLELPEMASDRPQRLSGGVLDAQRGDAAISQLNIHRTSQLIQIKVLSFAIRRVLQYKQGRPCG